MELTYQSPLMPASYTALSADEMTYIDGGAIQIGSYLIEFHPEALLQSVVNFTINFAQLMGKAALGTAVGGLVLMHQDGLTLSQSVSYYWDGQNKAGKAATVAVGALAGWYGAMQAIQIYNTIKSIFIELKKLTPRPSKYCRVPAAGCRHHRPTRGCSCLSLFDLTE